MTVIAREDKMDWWISHGLNVLFRGKHGVGKTSLVKSAFNNANLKWRYFSASTMDPWVDFVGVPREKRQKVKTPILGPDGEPVLDEAGEAKYKIKRISYLQLVRPRDFADGTVEALFFDEFNRAPKKVRNAVMELLQFKSINGERFPNLKVIWAAINPDDDEDAEYDVEKLDPAQADRFEVTVDIPYKPHGPFFQATYGERIAKAACEWWEALPDDMKKLVSPRRLDYALRVFEQQGDVRDVLPVECNVSKLLTGLNTGPITERLEQLLREKKTSEARSFLANDNNYASAMRYIPESDTLMEFFLPLLPSEKLATLMATEDRAFKFIVTKAGQVPIFGKCCDEILKAQSNARLVKKIRRIRQDNSQLAASLLGQPAQPAALHFTQKQPNGYHEKVADLKKKKVETAHDRQRIYSEVAENIPPQLTADDALATLELFDQTMTGQFISTIRSGDQQRLMGIINHCLNEIHRNTALDFSEICNTYGGRFNNLLKKIKDAGLNSKLLMPQKAA